LAVKLIAIDLDDTLLDDERNISKRNQKAVFEAVKQGVIVTVSTGRMYQSALPFARELKLDVPLIVYNGAMIKTSLSKEIICHKPVDSKTAKEVFSLAKKNNWYVQCYINDDLYVSELNELAKNYSYIAKVEIVFAGEGLFELPELSTKIMIQGDAAQIPLIRDEIKSHLGDKVSLTTSKPTFLEITNPGVNKGSALAMLAERLNIDRQDIMAVGDSGNDIEMLEFANWSVAMGNATDEAKAAARFLTGTNNSDGVAEAIEKFVLK
jgi:Cof subfamily protein (haloacid dehalogenase superfamily)